MTGHLLAFGLTLLLQGGEAVPRERSVRSPRPSGEAVQHLF